MIRSSRSSVADAHGVAPSSATSSSRWRLGSWAARSPSRWEQAIPAACMNAPSPIRCAHATSQVARSRPACNRRQARVGAQRGGQRVGQVVTLRRAAAEQIPLAGERVRPRPAAVEALEYRHRARPRSADQHKQPARALNDVLAGDVAQLRADQSRPRTEAHQRA